MTPKVIPLPTTYSPNGQELARLQNIQDAFKYTHHHLKDKHKNDKYALAIAKSSFYERVRRNIRAL